MTRHWTVLLTIAAAFVSLAAQDAPQAGRLLSRRYVEGDRVQYLMKGQDGGSTYEVRITGTTKKASDGRFVEEFAWTDMVANGAPRALAEHKPGLSDSRSRSKAEPPSKCQTYRRRLDSLGRSPI